MSFALADAMVVRVSPVAGFSTSRVSPSTEGTNSLLMKSPVGTVRDGISQILFHIFQVMKLTLKFEAVDALERYNRCSHGLFLANVVV